MKKENVIAASKILFNAKINAQGLIDLNPTLKPKNIFDAYEIQNELKNNYLSLNNNITIGKKVGCTNKEAQDQVGIHEPFHGNLFSNFSNISGCTIKSKNFFKPYIEPEISFIIKEDINISNYPFSIDDAYNLFEGFVCSIEIVDFRFQKPINEIGVENLIATNGASDYWIKGKIIYKINEINFHDNPVSIYINDNFIEKGNVKNVLKNPLNSAIWLINDLSRNGFCMLKGQYISTGSCTKAIKIEPNQKITAKFNKLETVEFEYI
tara:strand:+ start:204 stop:1001 length:798 start_codon:yes stop_codon:yes gene_type:complete